MTTIGGLKKIKDFNIPESDFRNPAKLTSEIPRFTYHFPIHNTLHYLCAVTNVFWGLYHHIFTELIILARVID